MTAGPQRVAPKGRRPVVFDPLRDMRHLGARAAPEATHWLSDLAISRKSPRTISEYGRIVDGLLGRHPDTPLGEFTEDELTNYIASFPEASRPVAKSALNGWFRWAHRKRLIPSNPVDLVPDIRAREQTLVAIFTDAEVAALTALPTPDGTLMRVLFGTGIRRGEAVNLQVKHINFDRRHIEIHRGKGGHDRLVSLPPVLAGKLDYWFTTDALERDDFLWYSRPGGHWRDHSRAIAASTFQRWWNGCLNQGAVEYKNPHASRHTFATQAIRAGISIDKVRRTLGHKNISTTVQTYVHMTVDDMHEDFALLETY